MARRAVTGAGREPRTPWPLLLCCGLMLAPGLLAATQTAADSESNVLNPVETGHFKRTREPVTDRLKSSGDISEHRHSAGAVNSDWSAGSQPAGPAGSGVGQDSTPALTSETVISNSPGAWAAADLSPVGVRSGQQLPIVPVSLVLPSARVKRSVTPSVRGTQDTSDRAQPDRQARAATVIKTTTGSQTSASPWDPQASFNAEPRAGRASKPDVNSVLSSIISLLGDNVRLVGPPADRAPNRGPNRQRPRPNPGRPASPTRINNRGPPQQFVPVKNRPAPPVKTRPAVRPYPSHLPPPLRPRPGQRPSRPQLTPGRPRRPPIAPYANGIPLPERLVPLQGEPLSPTVTTSVRQTVVTDAGKVSSSVLASKTPTPSTVSSTATSGVATVATAVPATTTTRPPPETDPETEAEAETTEKAEAAEGGGSGGSSEEKVPTTAAPERETATEPAPEVTKRPTVPPRPEEAVTPPETTTEDAVTTAPPPPPRPSGPAGGNPTGSDPPRAPARAPTRDRPRDPVRKPAREPVKTPERPPTQTPVRDPWVEIPSTANVPLSSSESSVPEFGGRPAAGRPSATPPLSVRPTSGRPGTVLDARPGVVVDASRRRPPPLRPQVFNPQRVGDVFDITVSAAQGGFGGGPVRRPPRPQPPSGQPYVIPVDINQLRGPGDIITEPDAVNNVVSIDGRRTYFDLSPTDTNAGGTYQTVGAGLGLGGQAPSNFPPTGGQSLASAPPSYQQPQWPQEGVALPPQPAQQRPQPAPQPPPQPPPQRRPQPSASSFQRRRPSPPPIRIDTCIVGDDSTCKREYNERCKTEAGVSSCHCRPGYSRLRPRTACKRVVSVVMTMKVDGVGDSRLAWQAALRNPRSEAFQQLAWDAEHAIATSMSGTTMRDIYMGNRVTSFYLLRGGVALNTTVSLLDTAQTRRQQVMDELQRQMNRAIRANDNIIGESNLFVEGLSSPVPRVLDLDECGDSDEHDCDENAECSNVFGSFTCQCRSGYDDRYRTDAQKAGRYCLSCTDDYCSDRGTCQIFDGEKTCQCRGSYYGARCDIDGEVLGAALGATAAAAVIIVATFICLCKWSKRWHKGQGHTKVEMGTLGAASGYSFMKPSAAAAAHANFQMGVEERLRWAQMAEAIGHQNLYAPEPMYGGGGGLSLYASQPNLPGPAPDGPASLNMTRAGRPPFPVQALRAMTPAYAGGERGPMGVPMGRSLRTPLPHPPADDDGPVRPRSRGSMVYDCSTLSAHDFPLQGVGSGSQQQLVYSSGRQQRPRHARSSSRDSIYETLSPHLGGSGATQLLTFDPKRDDKLFEKSNSWRMAF